VLRQSNSLRIDPRKFASGVDGSMTGGFNGAAVVAGGSQSILAATFGASSLIFWELVIEVRHLLGHRRQRLNAGRRPGPVWGVGGVLVGGYVGDHDAAGGHALAIGLPMLLAAPWGRSFMIITAGAAFMLSF
jgi:hypothetical protein